MNPTFIILTGGGSTRFGSDKSMMDFNGETLINRILRTLPPGEVIIVGPEFEQDLRDVSFFQESPPGSGPVAAVSVALAKVSSPEVFLIATDMPFASEIVNLLLLIPLNADALVPIDAVGKRQPLCGRYLTASLVRAVDRLGDPTNKSMRSLIAELDLEELLVEGSMLSKLVDIDTRSDYEKVLNNYGKELDSI